MLIVECFLVTIDMLCNESSWLNHLPFRVSEINNTIDIDEDMPEHSWCMMTSSMEILSALLALCGGIHWWIRLNKGQWRGASMFFFVLRLNKRLSKQSWSWWFETPSRLLWRHCTDLTKPGIVPFYSPYNPENGFICLRRSVSRSTETSIPTTLWPL